MPHVGFFCVPCRRTFSLELNEDVYDRRIVICPICNCRRPGVIVGPLAISESLAPTPLNLVGAPVGKETTGVK